MVSSAMPKISFAPTSLPREEIADNTTAKLGMDIVRAQKRAKRQLSLHLNLHIVKRLALIWLLISLGVGAIVVFFEIYEIDEQISLHAQHEAKNIITTLTGIEQVTSPDILQILQTQTDELIAQHFSIAEIYDLKRNLIVSSYRSDNDEIGAILGTRHHQFELDIRMQHEIFLLDGLFYQQILVPLKDTNERVFAYFEGVYKVDESTLATIKSSLIHHVLLVIGVGLATSFALYPLMMQLNRSLYRYSDELLQANIELMQTLGNAIALRDAGTNGHNYRVTLYAISLAEAIDLEQDQMRNLIAGSFLHDVGKIGISDLILRKADKLTPDERDIMRQHVELGVGIVNRAKWLKGATDIVQSHHEKYDGSGYPNGLKGQEIPLTARIFTIVDVFDALTSERPYKPAYSSERALSIMEHKHAGAFDPYLLHAFLKIAPTLHSRIALLSDAKLEALLNEKMRNVFFTQPGS
jgi:putative nucleotidyltransferase with HDIG domain